MFMVKIRGPDGRYETAERLDFKILSGPETRMELEDGTEICIIIRVTDVFRLNEHDEVTGDPVYNVLSEPLVRIAKSSEKPSFLRASIIENS
jgi:hypothetical protein